MPAVDDAVRLPEAVLGPPLALSLFPTLLAPLVKAETALPPLTVII